MSKGNQQYGLVNVDRHRAFVKSKAAVFVKKVFIVKQGTVLTSVALLTVTHLIHV